MDDDALIREALQTIIEDAGYTVLSALDGRRAIEVARGVSLGMLITDLQTADMDGLLLAERLTERQPELPVLIMCEAASQRLPLEEFVYRNWTYLSKPVDSLRLLETIEGSCGFGNFRPLTH